VKLPSSILTGQLESLVWIRPEGRGTFLESPIVENFVAAALDAGHGDFVIDLEACPGMDSTFMGMLAGLGIKFRKKRTGSLTILGTSEKTKASLIELGLHHLTRIEPADGPWSGRLEDFRSGLLPITADNDTDKASHVLECHENLCVADDSNLDRFKTVLEILGSEMVSRPIGKPDSAR
jgi:anti-anti-sigma regulatory factor